LSKTFNENLDSDPCETLEDEGDDEENDPNSFECTLESRVKDVTSGKVSRTKEGSVLGVLVPVSDPLYESIGRNLSENCCDSSCLSAFNTNEVYQFHLNLLEMTKEERNILLLAKLHVLSNAGDSTSHARKKGPKCVHVTLQLWF